MSCTDYHNEKLLLEKIANGDPVAFKHFFDLYKERIYIFVKQIIHSQDDTEEIVQDTFLKLWQAAPNLLHIDKPGQYVYTIARNKTLNYIRKISRDKKLIQQVWQYQADYDNHLLETLQYRDMNQLVKGALNRLSTQKQLIYNMSREEGLSHAEIAYKTGLSQSRVKNILVEVLQHLRECLQKHSISISLLFWLQCGYLFFS